MEYTVHDTIMFLDDGTLPSNQVVTRWLKCIPRKINVFLWWVALDRLPTGDNLARRGINIVDIGCVSCSWGIEMSHHVLFGCDLALDIWRKCRLWCNIQMPVFSNWSEFVGWFDGWMNIWDLTVGTELLVELPEEYTFETALADLIVSNNARLIVITHSQISQCGLKCALFG
ncbi:uncharacterized protein [Rutidosis leptorrhynchoides]|uniref:uncharacterized protein n=1 Tax=Rutidosis leptorrhynchoides TaxID=125765 RepID=UPI003A991D04